MHMAGLIRFRNDVAHVELVGYFINSENTGQTSTVDGRTKLVTQRRLHCIDLPPTCCCYFRPYLDSKECRPSVLTHRNRLLVQQGSIYVREATGSASQGDLCRSHTQPGATTDLARPQVNLRTFVGDNSILCF